MPPVAGRYVAPSIVREPAVGVALHVRDLQSNAIVWSGVGGRSGWSREALSAVAQKLIRQLLATAPIQ